MKHVVDMTNEERLEKLERDLTRAKRDNRRMIVVGVGIVLGALALLVVGGSPVSVARAQEKATGKTIIRAQEFVLVDEQSETRAELGSSQTKTPDGKVIIHPESSLLLYAPDGRVTWQAP